MTPIAVAAQPDDLEAALAAYEAALFPRSAAAAAEATRNHGLMFNDTAPRGLLDLFTGGAAPRAPRDCQSPRPIAR